MARAGAFSANFDPAVLDEFRSFCSARGEKYTKVLEQLAIAFLRSKGEVLSGAAGVSVPSPTTSGSQPSTTDNMTVTHEQDLLRRMSRLEENDEYNSETFETIFRRLEVVEQKTNSGRFQQ